MPALSEYSNVHDSVFNILSKKGYKVWIDPEKETYWAEKDGWDFSAFSPCALLGIVSLFEYKKPDHYKEYWWRESGDQSESTLATMPPDYVSVVRSNKFN
ncbi:hypothetical protein [Caballeronia sp. LZ034LL]|uniref:hypothetical protein n=1 Tax=Caballeronia sp. LZ034LL TaxID=3038567 RepID=UPI0028541F14|nr:hypothetical protein [Caballeronia sp. LZ034LL]MDR5835489.1 hypothetical protein [Caballeronia sp. LZ034LL]